MDDRVLREMPFGRMVRPCRVLQLRHWRLFPADNERHIFWRGTIGYGDFLLATDRFLSCITLLLGDRNNHGVIECIEGGTTDFSMWPVVGLESSAKGLIDAIFDRIRGDFIEQQNDLRQICTVLSTKHEALLDCSIDELAESKHSIPVLRLLENLLEFLRHSLTADELDRKAFAINSVDFDESLKVEWSSTLHDSKLSAITAYIDQLNNGAQNISTSLHFVSGFSSHSDFIDDEEIPF